jgi:putative ABC transport system substrate-binding protein
MTIAVVCIAFTATAKAQPANKVPRIGVLLPWSPSSEVALSFVGAFREGLRERGYSENRDLTFDYRYGDGVRERLPRLAAELVGLPVNLLVTSAGPPALAAKQATKTIPIVFTQVSDPVARNSSPASLAPEEISQDYPKRVRISLESAWSC